MTPTNDPPDPPGHGDRGDPSDGQGHQDRPISLEDLIALRDGDLDDEQARRVRRRIERDPELAADLLEELDQTDAILDQQRRQRPPPDLLDRLQSAIADEAAARSLGADQRDESDRKDDATEQ